MRNIDMFPHKRESEAVDRVAVLKAERAEAEDVAQQKAVLAQNLDQAIAAAQNWWNLADEAEAGTIDMDPADALNLASECEERALEITKKLDVLNSLGYHEPEWYVEELLKAREEGR